MSATFRLFERWKAKKGHTSNNAGALALGVARQTVQNWKEGRNGEADVIERMCADLGEDPVPVILEAFAEASRTAEAKRALMRLSRRFTAALAGMMLASAATLSPAPTQARISGEIASPTIHYANRRRVRAAHSLHSARPRNGASHLGQHTSLPHRWNRNVALRA